MAFMNIAIEWFFLRYAKYVEKYSLTFLMAPIVLTCVLTTGWLKFHMDDDLHTLFTPLGSEWHEDRIVFENFFGMTEESMKYALISTKPSRNKPPNLLDSDVAPELADTLRYLERNLTVGFRGKNYSYVPDLFLEQSPYHFSNEVVTAFLMTLKAEPEMAEELKSRITYPTTKILGQRLYLPFAFGGVTKKPNTSLVDRVRSILFRYTLSIPNDTWAILGDLFEYELDKFANNLPESSELDVTIYSWDSLSKEVRNNTWYTLTYVPGAILLVLIFTVVVCFKFDMDTSCHLHAIAGLISVLMSFTSALGLIFYLGFSHNDLVSVTTFLSLAIGVDDTFIMLAAWRRFGSCKTVRERIEMTLSEAGSSITFTSLTTVLAFGIGASMKVPALRDFCVFTSTAILFDFMYQVSFFPAAMIYAERLRPWNKSMMEKLPNWKIFPQKSSKDNMVYPTINRAKPVISESPEDEKFWQYIKPSFAAFVHRFVSSTVCQWICLSITILMLFISIVGTSNIHPSASFKKLLVDDSPTHAYVDHYDKYYWSEANLYHIIVKSPDFRNSSDVFRFLDFVNELEHIGNYSHGPSSTTLWLTEFFNYLDLFGIDYENLAAEVDNYLRNNPKTDVKTKPVQQFPSSDSPIMNLPSEFYFATGMRGIDNWPERAVFLKNLTALKVKYSEYSPAIFSEPIYLTDLLIYSENGLSQTLGIVLITTFFVTLLFLPWDEPILIFWVTTSFLAINCGVIGMLSCWSVDIDIISMVTLLMSVGFSVDYTVHLSYQFSRHLRELSGANLAGHSPKNLGKVLHRRNLVVEAAAETFDSLLHPIMCSGLSTLVAVFLMIFVKSYMVRVFLKTVFLVVILGLAQSLLILPMIFILTARLVPQRPM